MIMESPVVNKNLKRKRLSSSFPESIKSQNLPDFIQGTSLFIQKIGQKNDQEGVLTPPRAIKMLVRGLGSSNTQVQKNYFAALVALLKSHSSSPEFTVESVLDAITSELHATGHIKKGEEREILLGRVLSFGVLVRSQIIHQASKDDQATLLKQFFQDMKEKSYLPLLGDPFLIDYLKQVDQKLFVSTVWPLLSLEVRPGPDQPLLLYHCLLVCEERFPSVVNTKYLNKTLNSATVLSQKTVHGLLEGLKSEFWLKNLDHPAYLDIFKYIVSSGDILTSFWEEIEKELLVETASGYNKPIAAIKIFSTLVAQLQDASQVLPLLTPKLLGWFMKKFRSTGLRLKHLHKVIKDALNNLMTLCSKSKSSKTSYAVLKKVIFNPGSLLFDQLSGTKVVAQLVGQLKEKQIQKLVEVLRDVITGSRMAVEYKGKDETTRAWTNKEKLYTVHLLCRLIYNPSMQNNLAWRLEQLTFLFDMGFFPTFNIGVELAGSIRESFFNSFNQKCSNIDDFQQILSGVVEHINKRLSKGDQLRIKVPAEVLPAWNKMYSVAKQLESKKHKKDKLWLPKVFQTMFFHIGLHLFKEASFAKDVLEELHSVYARVDKTSQTEEEPHWTEVVMEMFLSLLSRNSHRHLLSCIFSTFCHIMTPQNIHQILQVLDPANNTNPLLDQLDSDSESSGEEEESGEEEVDDKEEEESSDDGMTDGDDDMEEDMEEKVNDKLRRAVIEALGDTGAMTDTESVDLDNMDENEAKRVDRALSAAFQAFKPSKKKKESSHIKALAHFRSRVLDLIEIWMLRVEKPPLDLTVDVLLRLMSLLEHSLVDKHQSQLETRVRSVIKKFTGSMSKKSFDIEDCKSLHLGNILKSLLDKGERTTTVYMSVHQELIDITMFIVKVSQQLPSEDDTNTEGEENPSVYTVLKDAMNSYFTQRDNLIPMKLFAGLFSLNIPFLSHLTSKLPAYAFDSNVPPYRQSKAVEYLILFWKNNRIVNEPSEELLERLKKTSRKLYKASVKMIEEPKGRVQDKFLNELKTAFKIIQKKNWLSDIDLEQHMENLKEFHQVIIKTRKINSQKTVPADEPMEVESDKKNTEDESEAESEDESDDDEDESDGENDEPGNSKESADGKEVSQVAKKKINSGKEDAKEDSENASEEESEDGTEESEESEHEDGTEEESDDESAEDEEEEEEDSEETLSEPEEPPTKKAKKKADKKKSREKLRRIQLLKNNSKKLRMESMSEGLNENVFSQYRLLLTKKTASPER
ncbi:myb-binding protein 1A-like [Macrosteles quadrilineatus]|uniref:myb-binding protein 1A-like n=1 Tax=Macrosteles quadrilineatus TaxID=74068 RepID=UPI0023E30ECB|nr:myb-binding protein 1A-like [Macrosteles quadrilineatus]